MCDKMVDFPKFGHKYVFDCSIREFWPLNNAKFHASNFQLQKKLQNCAYLRKSLWSILSQLQIRRNAIKHNSDWILPSWHIWHLL